MLDTAVLVSGAISGEGPSGQLVDAVRSGRLELVVCPQLLAELGLTLDKPRLRRYIPDTDEAAAYLAAVTDWATHHPDPVDIDPAQCRDPNDAYLLALTALAQVDALVSGDKDLTVLSAHRPAILTPRQALDRLDG